MRNLWLGLLATAALAQNLTLTGPVVAPAGGTVTLTISLVSGGGPAGLQWDMSGLPSGATIATPVTGKTATCNTSRCILSGVNVTAIPDGPVATIQYTQGTSPATVGLAATLGASPAGAAVTVAPPAASLSVPIQSPCDVNGDGKVDATDIGLVLQAALSSTTGSPTILDVIREVIAASGGACLR